MIWINSIRLVCLLSCTVFAMATNAQTVPITINPNKSVTITYVDSTAEEVKIQGNFFVKESPIIPLLGMFSKDEKADMEKGENGVWTYTTKPLTSELYWYKFIVNDSSHYDIRNKDVVRDIYTKYNYFIIPNGLANDYIDNKVKSGKLKYVWYPSSLNGMTKRRMAIYLPYGYAANKTKRYPVLYLLHGSGGDETSWSDCGRLVQIMDNLIASGRCEPMIVVMPNGNVELSAAPGEDPNNPNVVPTGNNMSSMFGKIESAFVPEIVKYVDANYRTIKDKKHRAIAGLSLGGLHTLYTAINNPDVFDYVGLFSAQTTNALNDNTIGKIKNLGNKWNKLKGKIPFIGESSMGKKISNITERASEEGCLEIYEDSERKIDTFYLENPALVYIAVGRDDFTKKLNDQLRKLLDEKNYTYLYNETDGGHTWTNWRRYLVDFLPRLFRN